ncbi:DUF4975 domain-containing protein [Flavobacterium sufflavum]|uniref:beta-fructofuranosidase n=1 Tax=Flavobacterium sufflavum TaxID=1921138 RepID=A0A437KQX9_9FLAO|nr:glycoside hydrolase family 32 protein [Flavobacterium sufflavum]RVT74351.1 DUF4975 domain-containing protein [Flavobacterium sufflavum]
MKKIYCIAAIFSMMFISCAQDDITKITKADIYGTPNVFPQPPVGWMGETDSYNTTGWVGDVMPYFDNGKFHLFFLHDASNKPAGKGYHDIQEFETSDLVNFDYNGRMIPYGATNEADFGVGTGSVVKVGNLYYFYYTGNNGIASFLQNNPRESVLCATSPDLKNWTKIKSFKLTAPVGYNDYDFRDPHVFYNGEDSKYHMIVSTMTNPGHKAVLLHFTTTNPSVNNWVVQNPIYTTTVAENYLMMECADIFKMGAYWYLFFSENWSNAKGTHYRMATSLNGPWVTPKNEMLDGEFLYAAKTASDGNKRYLFGWTARRSPENDLGNKDWAGNLVTYELTQNSDGTLGLKIPESVSNHFTTPIKLEIQDNLGSITENTDSFSLDGSNSPAVLLFSKLEKSSKIHTQMSYTGNTGNTGFVFAADNMSKSYYKIVLEPSNNRIAGYLVNGTNSVEVTRVPMTIEAGKTYDLDLVCDGSVCIVYVNGKVALSNRIYGMRGQKWGLITQNLNATYSIPLLTK